MSVLAMRTDGFAVLPDDLGSAAATFAGLRDRTSAAAATAATELLRSAGMGGGDGGLAPWRLRYDALAGAATSSLGVATATYAGIARRLTDTGDTYLAGEHAATPHVSGGPPRLPGVGGPGPAAPGPPLSSTGPGAVPGGVADLYSDGDPDRLRAAGRAWTALAAALTDTAYDGDAAFRGLTGANTGATFSTMRTFWARLFVPCATEPMFNAVAHGAQVLGTSYTRLAELIDRTRAAVLGAAAEAADAMSPLDLPARLLGRFTWGVTELELVVATGALSRDFVQQHVDAHRAELARLVAELSAGDQQRLEALRVPAEHSAPAGTGLHDVGEVLSVGVRGSAWDAIEREHPTPDMISIAPNKITHILDSDSIGGGHAYGTGRPGKSEFPPGWSREKILQEVLGLAREPGTVVRSSRPDQETGIVIERWQIDGVRDSVRMRVIVDDDGSIVTAFPRGGPGVHQNPK